MVFAEKRPSIDLLNVKQLQRDSNMAFEPFKNSAEQRLEVPQAWQPMVRHLSYRLTPLLMLTPITPNQVTALSLLFGVAAGLACLFGSYTSLLIGAFFLLGCYVLDNCDGEVARLKNMCSHFGMRFDTFVDWAVHAVFFICLGWGATLTTGQNWWLWTGIATAVGGTINYGLELYQNRTKPHSTELPAEETMKKDDDTDMDRFVFNARLVRSDFCFIVLFFSMGDVLWYLLPPAALGAQAYWCLQFTRSARRWHV
jgi:phosphatidylglycerophosphate synthase